MATACPSRRNVRRHYDMKGKLMISEGDAFDIASTAIAELAKNEQQVRLQSLAILSEYEELFNEALVLLYSGLTYANNYAPFADNQIKAAISLSILGFGTIRRGWLSLLDGYYSVALTLLRLADEAQIFQAAIGYSTRASELWYHSKLDIGKARKIIKEQMNSESASSGDKWEVEHRDLWSPLNLLTHANPSVTTPSLHIDPSMQFAQPIISPDWNQHYCQLIGLLYLRAATWSVVATGVALNSYIGSLEEWDRRERSLIEKENKIKERDTQALGIKL